MPRLAASPLLCALLLLLGGPALATDLDGLWAVEGRLPQGTRYAGEAALSPAGPGRYRIQGRAELETGQRLVWRARAELQGSTLVVTHVGRAGLIGRLANLGAGSQTLTGRYALAADAQRFAGSFQLQGASATGEAAYTRLATPQVRSSHAQVRLQVGEGLTLRLEVDPSRSAALLAVEGGIVRRHRTRGEVREVLLEGDAPGRGVLKVRLGPSGGAILLEIPYRVGTSLLDTIEERVVALAAAGQRPVVIFDLDDTIYDTKARVRQILRDCGAQIGDARLLQVERSHVHYELDRTLVAAGFSEAEAQGPLGRQIQRAWSRRFFHGDSYALDGLIPGAVDYVKRLQSAGATVVYLTGRKEVWRPQCLAVLRAQGLPEAHLYMKPDAAPGAPKLATEDFKEAATKGPIAALGTLVAAFDNEPGNVNAFRRALPPEASAVWLDTLYKPTSPALLPGTETVKDYR